MIWHLVIKESRAGCVTDDTRKNESFTLTNATLQMCQWVVKLPQPLCVPGWLQQGPPTSPPTKFLRWSAVLKLHDVVNFGHVDWQWAMVLGIGWTKYRRKICIIVLNVVNVNVPLCTVLDLAFRLWRVILWKIFIVVVGHGRNSVGTEQVAPGKGVVWGCPSFNGAGQATRKKLWRQWNKW